MDRKFTLNYFSFHLAHFDNVLVKRENFAVSLRKKKTREIINAKRRKINQFFN